MSRGVYREASRWQLQSQITWVYLQVDGAEGQIREQAERLSHMKTLQSEADSLRVRVEELQQHSADLEEEARLVPGLKSQVVVLTKQVRAFVSELAIF